MSRIIDLDTRVTAATTVTQGAAGITAINGAALDMVSYDGVFVVVPVGPLVAGAATSIKMQQGDQANLSDAADLAGSKIDIAVAAADTTFFIDLFRPRKRYVRVVVSRGTANATIGGITYIQYGPSTGPVTDSASVTASKALLSPAEGTA